MMSDNKNKNDDENNIKSKSFTAYDVQKVRLDKLFANIHKPVEIPQRKVDKKFVNPPEFVRNVMGSSAGAGSGEFHVYRHLRRKEYARLNFIETQARNEKLDEEYRKRVEENKKIAEQLTEKKRTKRLKKKQKQKMNRNKNKKTNANSNNDSESEEVEESNVEEQQQAEESATKTTQPGTEQAN